MRPLTHPQNSPFKDTVLITGIQVSREEIDQHVDILDSPLHDREHIHGMRVILVELQTTISVRGVEATYFKFGSTHLVP